MEQTGKIFIANLKFILKSRKISQVELSKGTGIPTSSICGYLKEENAPLLKQAFKICKFLNVSIDEMCGFKATKECAEITKISEDLSALFSKLNYEGKNQLLNFAKCLTLNSAYNLENPTEKSSHEN